MHLILEVKRWHKFGTEKGMRTVIWTGQRLKQNIINDPRETDQSRKETNISQICC